MTLTLDEVRKTKFHMARRTGYEVSEVDLFVDRVEASFAQLTEENQQLKQQVEALKQTQTQVGQREDRQEPTNEELRQQRQPEERKPGPPKPQSVMQQQVRPDDGAQRIVVTASTEASPAVIRLVQMATEQSEVLVTEATAEAKRTIEEATQKAHQITTDARTKSERVESEARVNAEKMTNEARSTAERVTSEARDSAQRVTSEAQSRAADVDRRSEQRRIELFAKLEEERDQLQDAVGQLRAFEANYRQSFTSHLKQQLHVVETIALEPTSKPALADGSGSVSSDGRRAQQGGSPGSGNDVSQPSKEASAQQGSGSQQSNTPRLDALLGENQRNG